MASDTQRRATIYEAMRRRAEEMRQPGETSAQAFARYIATAAGAEAYRAYQLTPPGMANPKPGPTTKPAVNVKVSDIRAMAEAKAKAYGKIEDAAQKYREANPELTPEQAITAVVEANPALYSQYLEPRAPLTLEELAAKTRQYVEELTGRRYGVRFTSGANPYDDGPAAA